VDSRGRFYVGIKQVLLFNIYWYLCICCRVLICIARNFIYLNFNPLYLLGLNIFCCCLIKSLNLCLRNIFICVILSTVGLL
jgi:hypothetical protein